MNEIDNKYIIKLRERFAESAMNAILSNPNLGVDWSRNLIAREAVLQADELIKELNQ